MVDQGVEPTRFDRGLTSRGKAILAVAFAWCVGTIALGASQIAAVDMSLFVLWVLFCLVALVSPIDAIAGWWQRGWRAAVPFLGCLLAVGLVRTIGPAVRRAQFRWALPRYEAVVREMEAGHLYVRDRRARVAEAEARAPLVFAVFARSVAGGGLVAEFHNQKHSTVHCGYFYCSFCVDTDQARKETDWPIERQVKPRWFTFSHKTAQDAASDAR